ncbi:hypothetical protein EON81_13595 [bacterium]|nr:MAG: hypothetical protein EON81_13595 [bacterium]
MARFPHSLSIPVLALAAALFPALAPAQYVVAWGNNTNGQCNIPVGLADVVQVAAGDSHSVALKADGTVVCWGDNKFNQLDVPPGLKDVVKISAGNRFTLALKKDKTVVGWGTNGNGLGNITIPATLTNVKELAAGGFHSLVIRTNDRVTAWGSNYWNQSKVPTDLGTVLSIAAGEEYSLAVKSDGTVRHWGYYGGGVQNVPLGLTNAVQVAAGYEHALALKSDGTVVAWGDNWGTTRVPPAGLSNVVQVTDGTSASLALKADGTVTSWGFSLSGLVQVPAGLKGVTQISSRADHGLALIRAFQVFIDDEDILSGDAATGTVTIPNAAPAGGTVVSLTTANGLLQVPATVTIPAGAKSATFPVYAKALLGPGGTDRIFGTAGTETDDTNEVKVTGHPATLGLSRNEITGGTLDEGSAIVSVPAPFAEDIVIGLQSSDPGLTLPATVVLPAGQTIARAPLGHEFVTADRNVTVTFRSLGTVASTAPILLRAVRGSIQMTPLGLASGGTGTGSVGLNGRVIVPLQIALSSSSPSVTLPASVTVAAGSNRVNFPVTAAAGFSGSVTLGATINGYLSTTTFYVDGVPTVTGVEVPVLAHGWTEVPGRVTLAGPAPAGGARVKLFSSDYALKVPAYVWVPEGATFADFTANTDNVVGTVNPIITAEIGTSSATDTIEVQPAAVEDLVLTPTSVKGGTSFDLTVKLNAKLNRNVVVTLSYAGARDLHIPGGTTVLKGTDFRTIPIRTDRVRKNQYYVVTVSWNGTSVEKTFNMTP